MLVAFGLFGANSFNIAADLAGMADAADVIKYQLALLCCGIRSCTDWRRDLVSLQANRDFIEMAHSVVVRLYHYGDHCWSQLAGGDICDIRTVAPEFTRSMGNAGRCARDNDQPVPVCLAGV